jgi:hypothetical protein
VALEPKARIAEETQMDTAPSVLLLDDGELDSVRRALDWLNVDFEHVLRYQGRPGVIRPENLLVTTAKMALQVKNLECVEGMPPPVWVCAHNQDFLPMRERLRSLGVHYLVNSNLELQTMRLFFLQILYRGGERRRSLRLPMNEEVRYQLADVRGKGRLEELSENGCCLRVNEPAPAGTPVIVKLPPELGAGKQLTLAGCTTETIDAPTRDRGEGYCTIVVFGDLEPEARAQIQAILDGEVLGTNVTPLGPTLEPIPRGSSANHSAADVDLETAGPGDRRTQERLAYGKRVSILEPVAPPRQRSHGTFLDPSAPDLLLGRDLSLTGLRVDPHPDLEIGKHVILALYGGDEPLHLEAEVVHLALGGFGLQFDPLSAEQRAALEQLLEHLSELESLEAKGGMGHGIVVSRLIRQD